MLSLIALATLLGVSICAKEPKLSDVALAKHNEYRAMHGVPPMTWHKGAAKFAKNHCDYLAETNTFTHSHEHIYGRLWLVNNYILMADLRPLVPFLRTVNHKNTSYTYSDYLWTDLFQERICLVVLEEHGLVKWLKLWTPGTRNMSILTLTILMNRRQVMVINGMIMFYLWKRYVRSGTSNYLYSSSIESYSPFHN